MRRKSRAIDVGNLLTKWLKKNDYQKKHLLVRLQQEWQAALGERIAAQCYPRRLRDGVLTVVVRNSTWLNELSFLRADIMRQVNQRMGRGVVHKLQFEVGKIPRRNQQGVVDESQPPERVLSRRARQLAHARANEDVPSCEDDELRNAIVRARRSQLLRAARDE
jgi:hypothetical protein